MPTLKTQYDSVRQKLIDNTDKKFGFTTYGTGYDYTVNVTSTEIIRDNYPL